MKYSILYIGAFIMANLLVLKFGKIGILISSLIFIPFDFIMRCFFQETLKGKELYLKLGGLILIAGVISFIINSDVKNIAIASFFSFISSQVTAGIIYNYLKNKTYLIKVNGSDLIAIVIDSIIFQYIAFNMLDYKITLSQIVIKFIGGFIWYVVLFKIFKIQKKWN